METELCGWLIKCPFFLMLGIIDFEPLKIIGLCIQINPNNKFYIETCAQCGELIPGVKQIDPKHFPLKKLPGAM